ncbi:efflux RND transporter permease subunit [Cytophagales bacterium LB-30]|uniref:Efflux RND transporter permease subunit n=1 Tax=Shiella aurantiaca TaxID=3058365 RepID=A0ABT8F0I3_9BACT|nr:efflux RND transporter permease subunit [Shiella aurantiaca]MDN4163937.1 efflux RND transporter permease subunit [Shiella aurantiaca]
MKIAEFSVKNYQFTLTIFALLVALGLNSLFNMPRGEDPETESPFFSIVVVYPGTSPADMEKLVVDPLEKRINELNDIKKVITDINDGLAVVRVEYKYESDVEEKYQEIVREVNSLRTDELPQDLFAVLIDRFASSDVNIFQLALISETASYSELETEVEKLEDALEAIKGLKKIQTWGYPEQEVQVELKLDQMAQNHIPLNAVLGALQSENINIPGGSITLNTRKFNVKTSGDYKSIEEIKNTIVYSANGKLVYLKDVADVRLGYQEETYKTRLNGNRAVLLTASQKEKQNIFAVSDKVQPLIDSFEEQLPAHITLVKNFDQSESVAKRLGRFSTDFLIAILLVSITLLPLGSRAAIVVMISIPLSIFMGLFMMDLMGYSINQLSIVGLIVALGILVDDAIVVIENIERYLRAGISKKEAAIQATKQIGLAVVGCTATLILAFLPLVFLPEAAGDFIRSLPMAVITTVLASLFVSLTIVPFLSSRMLKNHTSPEGNIFYRALKKVISGSYSKVLHVALNRPVATLVIALILFGGSLMLFRVVGFSLFPRSEKPQFLINIEAPNGTALAETDRIARFVEEELKKEDLITYFTTNVGKGNPRVYYNVIQKNESTNFAQFFVQVKDGTTPETKTQLIDKLREKFMFYPNARIEVKDFEQGPPLEAPVAMRIFGENLDTLRHIALEVEQLITKTPGTIYVNNPLASQMTDIRIKINKEKAGILGVQIGDIDKAIRMGIAGFTIGQFTPSEGKDDIGIKVSLPKEGTEATFAVFDKIYVNSYLGQSIPLKQVADIEFGTSPNLIRHFDKNRYATVTAFVKSGYLYEDVTQEVMKKLDAYQFPEGYYYQAAGEVENKKESFGGIETIILITAFGFIAVLILEFGTFKSTLIVLSVIPLGVIGAVTMLFLTGNPMSFVAVIGLIALVGIEVKNSILLVDFTNQLRARGVDLQTAIEQAGEIRFVPIVLTSLTAIGGLIPLAIEGNPLYSPLALVLIGGLISSTLLSRLVTPVMYKLLPPSVEVVGEQPGDIPLH